MPDAVQTEPTQQVHHKERQPTHNEHTHHDPQSLGRLLLLSELSKFPAQREVLPVRSEPSGRHPRQSVILQRGQRLIFLRRVQVPRIGPGDLARSSSVDAERQLQLPGAQEDLLRAQAKRSGLDHSRAVDAIVREDHHEQRKVEGDGGGEDEVSQVLGEGTFVVRNWLVPHCSPPDDGREGDGTGADPNGCYKQRGTDTRHPHWVRYRVSYSPVSVQRNNAQIQNGRRAKQHIQGPPDVAPVGSKEPHVFQHFVQCTERHHH